MHVTPPDNAQSLAARLPPLILAAQRLASAIQAGPHGRRRAGSGDQFWQYRPAQAGDVLAAIDWRQSARGDDLLIREREWTAPRSLWLWRDGSASMSWRSAATLPTKAERALLLLLAVAEMARRGGERAMAGAPATRLDTLWSAAARIDATPHLPDQPPLRRGGAMVLAGDFLAPLDQLNDQLRRLAAHGGRGHVVHLLDPAEQIFPYSGRIRFEGCEGEPPLLAHQARDWQATYTHRFAEHCQHVANLCRSLGWSHLLHRTDQAPQSALLALHAQIGGTMR